MFAETNPRVHATMLVVVTAVVAPEFACFARAVTAASERLVVERHRTTVPRAYSEGRATASA